MLGILVTMIMQRLFIKLFCILFLISCATSKNNTDEVIGLYKSIDSNFNAEILLKRDNSFVYNFSGGLIKTESKGIWEVINKNVVLSSNKEYLNNVIKVKEVITDSKEIIQIIDSNGVDCVGAAVSFNDEKDVFPVDDLSRLEIPSNKNVQSFIIYFLGEEYEYKVLNPNSKSFIVTVYLADLSKTYFDNEKMRMKKGLLINSFGIKFSKRNNDID